ncbi:MAG: O-antigen ligase family protein [Planctomycetaceae bacterium]|nr:O-antigen ligase family protein [Planctomycetaceae bacterium]
MTPLLYVSGLLLLLSLMWPSEGAINGDGLHLTCGWLLTAAVASLLMARRKAAVSLQGGLGVVVLMIGFYLSTGQVTGRRGDGPAATYLTLEWTALAGVWLVLRLCTRQHRQTLLTVLLATCVGCAVYGFAQYFVFNQQTIRWYEDRLAQLDLATTQVERQVIERELQQVGVPADRTGRELFQRRLLDSTEPTGPFALANTFGGVLAVAVVLLFAVLRESRHSKLPRRTWLCSMAAMLCLAGCLMLTKSRTAWVGCLCGIGVYMSLHARSARTIFRSAGWLAAAGGLVLAAGTVTGVLDREVVLESPKSLQYRLFYWMGASGVIQESPLWGVGPGNFRQAYLRHKVPESSEEILDPHNIFFDTWATVGIIGLAGLLLMLISVVLACRRRQPDPSQTTASRPVGGGGVFFKLAFAAVGLHAVTRFLFGESLAELTNPLNSQTALWLIPVVMAIFASQWNGRIVLSQQAQTAAFSAIMIHLCGAGGLQITVCGLLMMVLHSGITEPQDGLEPAVAAQAPQRLLWLPGVWCLLLTCSSLVILGMHLKSGHFHAISTANLASGRLEESLLAAQEAVAAEPGPKSRQQLAQVLSYAAMESVGSHALDQGMSPHSEAALAAANVAIENLISADRRSVAGPLMRSQLMEYVLRITGERQFADRAIDDLRVVVLNYPTNVDAWARLAILEHQIGQTSEATDSRDRALFLEQTNRRWGHIDRYLSEEQTTLLSQIPDSL